MGGAGEAWPGDLAAGLYALTPPVEIAPLDKRGGSNNDVRVVRTGAGQFLWKRYLTHADPARILAEHRLLAWLDAAGLPFAVPAPLRTRDGATLTAHDGGTGWRALFAWLPGGPLDRGDPATIAALGAALGALHTTLARLPPDLHPALTPYGDLGQVHPRLPAPATLTPPDLGLPDSAPHREQLAAWRALLAGLGRFIDGPYRALPRQVIHGDFGPGNALAAGARITALLDFEFALYDARALDVAAGLSLVTRIWEWAPPASLALADAFCRGYARTGTLTPAEIAALPRLQLLREVVSAIWWLGRALAAGEVHQRLDRLADLRALDRWLAEHGAALVAIATRAFE